MVDKLYSISLIEEERLRQINKEGYTAEHDDTEDEGELSRAAALYTLPSHLRWHINHLWPWSKDDYKPNKECTHEGRIRELVKAGALIAAEIDRIKRVIDNDAKKNTD